MFEAETFKRRRLTPERPSGMELESRECADNKHVRQFREAIHRSWLNGEFCDVALISTIKEKQCQILKKFYKDMCDKAVTFVEASGSSEEGKILVEVLVQSAVVAALSPALRRMIRSGGRKGSIEHEMEEDIDGVKSSNGHVKETGKNTKNTEKNISLIRLNSKYVDGYSLCKIIRYIYVGAIDLSSDNIENMFKTAHHLDIKGALELCSQFLLQTLHSGNALSVANIGKSYECGDLEEEATLFICNNFVAVSLEPEWLHLRVDTVENILEMNDLVCVSEKDVLAAAYRWAVHGSLVTKPANEDEDGDTEITDAADVVKSRLKHLGNFFERGLIRLAHLPEEDLLDIKSGRFFDEEKRAEYPNGHAEVLAKCIEAVDMELHYAKNEVNIGENGLKPFIRKTHPEPRKYDYIGGTRVTPHCCESTLEGHDGYVYTVKEIDDGILASGSRDQTIKIWDIHSLKQGAKTARPMLSIEGHRDRVVKLWKFNNASGKVLFATCSFDNTVRIWQWDRSLRTCTCLNILIEHEDWVTSITTCSNFLITGSADNTIKLWDIDNFKCVKTLTGHQDHVYGLCEIRKSDGTVLLASGSQDKTIKIWDPKNDWKCIRTLEGHAESVRTVFQYNDTLVSGSSDRMILVWSICGEWKMINVLQGHNGVVEALVGVPESDKGAVGSSSYRYLVSASRDNSIKLWDVDSAKCQSTLTGHKNWVKGLAVTNDGRLVSASADGTVKIWKTTI